MSFPARRFYTGKLTLHWLSFHMNHLQRPLEFPPTAKVSFRRQIFILHILAQFQCTVWLSGLFIVYIRELISPTGMQVGVLCPWVSDFRPLIFSVMQACISSPNHGLLISDICILYHVLCYFSRPLNLRVKMPAVSLLCRHCATRLGRCVH